MKTCHRFQVLHHEAASPCGRSGISETNGAPGPTGAWMRRHLPAPSTRLPILAFPHPLAVGLLHWSFFKIDRRRKKVFRMDPQKIVEGTPASLYRPTQKIAYLLAEMRIFLDL